MRRKGRLMAASIACLAAWVSAGATFAAGAVADPDPNADPNAIPHAGTERLEVTVDGAVAGEAPTTFGTVIRPEDFAGRVTSLADLLDETVGVRVRSYGGLNSFATVSVRGSTAEQVAVFVDGVPVNSPLGGGVNLADFPLAGLEAIEVYRGFTPASLGSASIGGALNLRTRRAGGGTAASGSVAAGSFGTGEVTALADWVTGRVRWAGTAQGFASQGGFSFLDNNATTLTTSDDRWARRANNSGWASLLRLRGETALPAGARLSVSAEGVRRRHGVPGIDAYQSGHASFSSQRGMLRVEGFWPGAAGSNVLGLEAGLDHEYTSQGFDDADEKISPQPQDVATRFGGTGARTRLLWRPSPAHRVSFLLEPRHQSASITDRLHPASPSLRARRVSAAAVAEDEIHIASGRLLLAPSLRWDWIHDDTKGGAPSAARADPEDSASVSGRLGGLVAISPRWSLRGNVGRFYRAPSLLDRYGNQGTIVGNPALLPERGVNADLGVAFHGATLPGRQAGERPRAFRSAPERPGDGAVDLLSAEIILFRTDADDLIQFLPLPSRVVKAFNIGRARIEGVEASASLRLFRRLSGAANCTFQRATDRGDTFRHGSDLPGRPRFEANTSATLALGRASLFHRFSYVGRNDLVAIEAISEGLPPGRLRAARLPARYLHDVGISLRIGDHVEATLDIDNLFDRHVVDVARYPLPGRAVFVKISARL